MIKHATNITYSYFLYSYHLFPSYFNSCTFLPFYQRSFHLVSAFHICLLDALFRIYYFCVLLMRLALVSNFISIFFFSAHSVFVKSSTLFKSSFRFMFQRAEYGIFKLFLITAINSAVVSCYGTGLGVKSSHRVCH